MLLDGLDELGNEREDEQTKTSFDPRLRFIERIPSNNRLLITCRVKDYAEIGKKLTLNGAITLQPLNDDQMRAYLAKQPDLLAAIEADTGLRDMARTPLILSLFTFAYSDMSTEAAKLRNLTHSPGDLRDKIVDTYVRRRYEREARKPNAKLAFTLEEIYEILGSIATKSVARDAISSDSMMLSMVDFANETGPEKAEAFIQLVSELHLLVPDTNESWKFIHATIRGYFTFSWALQRVQTIDFPPTIRRRCAYALAYLKDPRSYDVLAQTFPIRNQALNVRGEIAFALGRLGDKRASAILVAGLEDDEAYIRYHSAVALGEIGDRVAIKPVLALLNDAVENGRYGAVRALGKLGDLSVVRYLIPVMLNDPVDFVRSSAARSLGQLQADNAVDALAAALNDSDNTVRICAVQALEHIATPKALSTVAAWRQGQSQE